jgi:1-aminocyclopropane-1-carboxylate deaminase/D-cysteine desulfhydrase-like pyridoxal-dependent ACC family enzyme
MTKALANVDRTRHALAKATTLHEVKQIREIAESARAHAKRAHMGRQRQNEAAEIALLAARKAGAILKQLQKTRPQSAAKSAGDSEYRKALKDTDTRERTARYWQQLADVPELVVKKYFNEVRKTEKGEISAAGLRREANKRKRDVARFTRNPTERKRSLETGRLGIWEHEDYAPFASAGNLASEFIVPPFSTFDLKQGYWSDRKRYWEEFGIKGEAGRGEEHEAVYNTHVANFDSDSNISEFNPALTEVLYAWFVPEGGHILDPFAGGSTRGIVAAWKGYKYTGIELRTEQIEENIKQVASIKRRGYGPECFLRRPPKWICGDSANLSSYVEDNEFDMIIACPPYYDLERYTTSDERDGSRCKTYEDFMAWYENIFHQAVQHLKHGGFAVLVVGEIRDKRTGYYRNFVGDSVSCLQRLGLHYYNEIILLTPVGSAPVRVGRQFPESRKVVKTHQNVLVFLKGNDCKAISRALPAETEKPFSEGPMFDEVMKDDAPVSTSAAPDLTPVELHGDFWIKRDDLFSIAGVCGGKARTCWHLAQGAPGLVTAGSRSSPQVNIVAQIAKHLGIPARAHTPTGELSPELLDAQAAGCEVVRVKPGHNTVIIARARTDAAARGWREIPYGMECDAAIALTRAQVANVPREIKRLVIPVGSGMSLAGVLWGMRDCGLSVPVLGVRVGADPRKQLVKYAPPDWERMVKLTESGSDYHKPAEITRLGNIALDHIYEGKCVPFLKTGDLLWIVGIRRTAVIAEQYGEQVDKDEVATVK